MRRTAMRPTLERCEGRILLAKKLYVGNLTEPAAAELAPAPAPEVSSTASLTAPAATVADRPFRGRASGAIIALDPTTGAGVAQYTGQATHLGRFTRTEYFQLDGLGGITGTMVFTAANGDRLELDFEGRFTSPTTIEGAYEFTGGTGRFRDASGTASIQAVLGDQGQVEVDFDGTLRY